MQLNEDCKQVWWNLAYDSETYIYAMLRQNLQDAKMYNKYWQKQKWDKCKCL